ncbi:hypothetical protein QBC35DRAFT_539546 [Podospora australis]|uniref:FAD-binding PCMH-type domain-containing protein n=1 Tax=Podospora australis TaxID=1536484 RepID=A0AAN7AMI1_9PEZI|nr:hypothetical protein QBC35DRAFT_539546 [Podospora australis]
MASPADTPLSGLTPEPAPEAKPDTESTSPDPAPIHLRTSTPADIFSSQIWSRTFNQRRDATRLPFGFCKPRTVADIIAAVELANSYPNVRISIRSGGHSWAAWSARHEAILLDLIDLDGGCVEYHDRTGIVSCPPAVTSGELSAFLGKRGRMFPGGHCPDVGMGGFLLQGGMGWNCKNPDLFFAARRAGPGFPGIVTRFWLRTVALGEVYKSVYLFSTEQFNAVLQWIIEISPTAHHSLEIVLVSQHSPDCSTSPPTLIAAFTSFSPSRSSSLAALSPIHDSLQSLPVVPLAQHFCQPTSLPKEYAQQLATNARPGFRTRSDNAYLSPHLSPDETASVLKKAFLSLPTKESSALWFAMAPTSSRSLDTSPPHGHSSSLDTNSGFNHPSKKDGDINKENDKFKGRMALSMQSAHYVALYAVWASEKDDERCDTWIWESFQEMEAKGVVEGSYLGDADFQFREAGWRFWTEEKRGMLEEVRARWDPTGKICSFLDKDEPHA